jgi:hypothetical protein
VDLNQEKNKKKPRSEEYSSANNGEYSVDNYRQIAEQRLFPQEQVSQRIRLPMRIWLFIYQEELSPLIEIGSSSVSMRSTKP